MNEALRRYRDQRVLVTGASGFKGTWLCTWLTQLGASVRGLSLPPPTTPSLFERCGMASRIAFDEVDVRDLVAVQAVVDDFGPDLVFHLAAQALVRPSFADPIGTLQTNAMGTAHVLEAVRQAARPCAVVIVSSDKCYREKGQGAPHAEDDPLGGADPYSASKGCTEIITASWRRSFFSPERLETHRVAVASVRAGNVFGPGDYAQDRLVPDCVRALSSGAPIGIRRPTDIRPWQHVLEPLGGYLSLGERLLPSTPIARRRAACGAWNFGPAAEDEVSVQQVVRWFIEAWGAGQWTDGSQPDDPPESSALRLQTDKARSQLGWQPTWDLREALRRTATGYQHLAQASATEAMAALRSEISAFSEALARPNS